MRYGKRLIGEQNYTVVSCNEGFDFDSVLAANVDGWQMRATRAGDITFDGMKIVASWDVEEE